MNFIRIFRVLNMATYRRVRLSAVCAFALGFVFAMLLNRLGRPHSSHATWLNRQSERYPGSRSIIRNNVHTAGEIYLRYLREYATAVDGWIYKEIYYVVWVINQYQVEQLNLFGGIGEIGVHHGKFTCFLYLLRRYEEQNLFAVDVFDNQELNKDGSGRGQKEIFLKNVREYSQIYRNELAIYSGSSLDLNPIFSSNTKAINWWKDTVVGKRGLQLVSVRFIVILFLLHFSHIYFKVDGGHTSLLTYSDLCLVANGLTDGGVVTVDDITHPGWLGVQDGAGRFLAETSKLSTDYELENEFAKMPNRTNLTLSERIIQATTLDPGSRTSCARLVPFLQFFNKLFLTTPKYYPYYIELLGHDAYFANKARDQGISYLEYHALRLTVGNVPIWTNNHDYNITYSTQLFQTLIEPDWINNMKSFDRLNVGLKAP